MKKIKAFLGGTCNSSTWRQSLIPMIAEVVDDSNKRPQKTILVILDEDDGKGWDVRVRKSLTAVAKMVKANGGQAFDSLEAVAAFLIAAAEDDDSHVE